MNFNFIFKIKLNFFKKFMYFRMDTNYFVEKLNTVEKKPG